MEKFFNLQNMLTLMQDVAMKIFSTTMTIILIIVLAKIVIEITKITISKIMSARNKESNSKERIKTIQMIIANLIKYVAGLIVLLVIITACGVSSQSLIAGAGLIGIIIGLGAQELIQDTVNGFFVVFEGTYDVGEYVSINGHEGYVKALRIKSTILKTYNNELITIPNSKVQEVINYSKNTFKLYYYFNASYQMKDEQINEFIHEKLIKEISKNPVVKSITYLGLDEFSEYYNTHCLEVEIPPEKRFSIKREMNKLIKTEMDQNKFLIPYKKIDVGYKEEINA